MNTVVLNVISVIILVLMVLITFVIKQSFSFDDKDLMWTCVLMIPYFCFHEVLHSIGYVLHGAKFNRITYGAHIEKGVLCCLCKQNISKRCILTSLLYPFIFIGVITYIIAMIFDIKILLFLSIMNISGCAGDLMMFISFLNLKNIEYSEFDDPISFGLYSDIDYSKKKMLGINYIKGVDELERKDMKKVSISKTSIIFFILLLATAAFCLFI